MTELPADVVEWVRSVFSECNARVTGKLSRNPNIQEEALDQTWIEQLGHFSAATRLASEWLVKIESHYLGGMRHFGSWEIADIGVLVFLRLGPADRKQKVALLQSKRLYPSNQPVRDELRTDYEVGFARLADPENEAVSIGLSADFRFDHDSRYGALIRDSAQVQAIDTYQTEVGLKVYYQLYNPWTIPFVQRIPLKGYVVPDGAPDAGVRILPAALAHARLGAQSDRTPGRLGLRRARAAAVIRLAIGIIRLRRAARVPRGRHVRFDHRCEYAPAVQSAVGTDRRRDRHNHRGARGGDVARKRL